MRPTVTRRRWAITFLRRRLLQQLVGRKEPRLDVDGDALQFVEHRLRVVPRLEADQLRAIRTLGCYRDAEEQKFVHRRLAEITEARRRVA